MIKEKDYLKAKQIVQEYENQLNISDVSYRDFTKEELKTLYKNNESFRKHMDNIRENVNYMVEAAMISTIRMCTGYDK